MKEKYVSRSKRAPYEKARGGLKVKTRVKAGQIALNRCETQVRREKPKAVGVKVKTGVKAGGLNFNRCERKVR